MEKQKILESKILIPDIQKNYEQREKLLSELQTAEGKLLVLRSTIGYGKTVLMSQYARLPGHICAWYHLDSMDNEPATFIRYLILSLDKALGGFNPDGEPYCEAQLVSDTQLVRKLVIELEEHLENMEGRKLVLALDDFQVLENPEIFIILEEFLDHIDHRFLLMAATRGTVPDSFTKYFMRRQGTMIGTERLSFCEAEVNGILGGMLSGETAGRYAEMIWKNTEGWPAGVMFSALYLCRKDGGASDVKWEHIHRESWVQNYITYELYEGLSYDIQHFLLCTSFAEELWPQLCNHICGIRNADDILKYLMRENMFIRRIDGTDNGYRYHPIFRSFLNDKAGEELKRDISEKIANYYRKYPDSVKAEKVPKNGKGQLLEVSCFGRFRVVIPQTGKEISWRTRKARELFAYLVDLEGRPVDRRALLELLWPDNVPNNEVAMLHNMIYNIRKELSDQPEFSNLIRYRKHQYSLDVSQIRADLESKKHICRLAEMGKADELYEYRDELLNHWGVYLKEVDGTWCMARRAYFERIYGKACSILADYCRKRGDFETEAACWNAYMAADRYSEEAVAGLLRCYANMGARSQLRQIFEAATKIFSEEMGIELNPETVQIYEQGMRMQKR